VNERMKDEAKTSAALRGRHAQVAAIPGVRTLSRPLPGGGTFDLAYTRTGPRSDVPVLVFPGGPGLASVLPYRALRAKAEKLGLDMVMMEHRGVGLSRTDVKGVDLPCRTITITEVIDDAAAILAAEGIDRALVYGTSYGSYLAQGFGVRHPDKVAGMVLDSVMLGAHSGQSSAQRLRDLFWHGTPATQTQAGTVRRLVEAGVIRPDEAGFPLQFLYELGGLPFIDRMLTSREQGRGQRVWQWIQGLGTGEVMMPRPFMMEFDLVGEIAFRELDYAPTPDGGPLESASSFAEAAGNFSTFEREPFDLPAEIPAFTWPTVIISGDRDIRTPRTVAEQITKLIPDSILLSVRDHGHSALDTHPTLALEVTRAAVDGIRTTGAIEARTLPSDPHGTSGLMHRLVSARLALTRITPRALS
jgi:proline iminopeptidase